MKQRRVSFGRFWLPLVILAGVWVPAAGLAESSYETVLANPTSWPREVEVKAATKGRLLQGDQIAGLALIGAGRKLTVLRLRPDGVVVRYGSSTVLLAVDQTNLLAVAEAGPAPCQATRARAVGEGAKASGPKTALQRLLVGRLVKLEGGALKPYDLRQLNGVKFYGLMFSAGWCGPCREFAPHLLDSYRRLKEMYPEFELVLVSNDRSPADMLAYMREEAMPWPAIKYSELGQIDQIMRLEGPGIPCLVLVDAEGNVLADSFKGRDYLGPDSVLDATWRVLKKSRHGG